MGAVIVILVIAAVIGAIVWNKRNAAAAMAGVQFELPVPPGDVSLAIAGAYNVGASAKLKSVLKGVKVSGGGGSFAFATKIGDSGRIEIQSTGTGTLVRASTDELYVGSHPRGVSMRSSLWGFASRLSHRIYQLLGITPGAARMKRFQNGLEATISRQLRRAAR